MRRTVARQASWALAALAVAALTALVGAATASAASAPSVASESVSHITATDATLEAQINPNGLETTYEFHLTSPACQRAWPLVGPCFAISGFPLPSGTINAQSGDQTVSLDLNSVGVELQPGTWYEYALTASNSAGEVTGHNAGEGPGIGRNFAGGGGEQNFKTLAGAPLIESESLSHLTPTDGTLEAQINTEGLETTYDFELQTVGCSSHGVGCELAPSPVSLPSGKLLGSFAGQKVRLDLNSAGVTLGKGEWFYTVTATNATGTTTGTFHQFEAPSAGPPAIDSESASNVTEHDATLNAQINPNGAATTYFFEIDTIHSDNFTHPNCPFGPCASISVGPPLPPGLVEPPLEEIRPPTGDQSVGLDLASIGATLQPGTTYYYRVIAHDALSYTYPPVYGPEQSFTTPSAAPLGAALGQTPAIQSPPFTSPTHHQQHKRRRQRAKLHRTRQAG